MKYFLQRYNIPVSHQRTAIEAAGFDLHMFDLMLHWLISGFVWGNLVGHHFAGLYGACIDLSFICFGNYDIFLLCVTILAIRYCMETVLLTNRWIIDNNLKRMKALQ